MRLPLLLLPLVCLAGCMSNADRPASAAATPAQPQAPAAAAPAVTAPAVTAPTPAAAPAGTAPKTAAAQPAPKPVTVDLAKFTGPTENAEHFGYDESNGRIFMYSGGTIILPVTLTADGDYEIALSAACDEADGQKARFSVTVDGQALGEDVTCTVVDAKEYVIKAPGLKAGDRQIAVTLLNDIYKENEYDLNFYVHGATLRPAK